MGAEGWAALAAWVTLVLGLWLTNRSLREAKNQSAASDAIAREANEKAGRALELAEAAEERATRTERIAAERHDVHWVEEWIYEPATLTFRNVGTDSAHDVEVIVDVVESGQRRMERHGTVGPNERAGIRLEVDVRAARLATASNPPNVIVSYSTEFRARVTWRSDAGAHGTQEWESLRLR